jgi:hypothetical protein
MPSIVTHKFKFSQLKTFRDSLANASAYYYLGIAKPTPWGADDLPTSPSDNDGFDFPELMSVLRVDKEKTIYVVPRINWRKGDLYDYYGKASASRFYVLTSTYKVYKCIDVPIVNGIQQPSTIEPTSTSTSIVTTSDNYKWKYMFALTTSDVIGFLTNSWMPVRKIVDGEDVGSTDQQTVQDNSIPGTIDKYEIVLGGTGYNNIPTLVVKGNGVNATATASISGGSIVGITITNKGQGYTYATVQITPNILDTAVTPAEITPVISPILGHGSDAVSELLVSGLMINNTLSFNAGAGDFTTSNDYRKIFLMNGLTKTSNGATAIEPTYSAMEKLKFQTVSYSLLATSINPDDELIGLTSGASARVVDFDSGTLSASIVFKEKDFISNQILTYTISTAGAGYHVGDVVGFSSASDVGIGAKAYVTSVSGTGGITGLNFDTGDFASRGKNYGLEANLVTEKPNEVITSSSFDGDTTPSVAAQITVTSTRTEDVKVMRGSTDTQITGNKLVLIDSEINRSGNIIYKDYRSPITRDINQREQLIIVLGF